MTDQTVYDLAIIGGGVNGCGIARDAVGRGLSVYLCEQGDLAQATSSASTKLIHGGLRYLEYYEFRLVREALIEREVLLRAAPHIIWPMRFILPLTRGCGPAWLLRLGLFIYDHLGGRKLLPGTHTVDLDKGPLGAPLKDMFRKGFEYSDCWVEDSRLVILNAMDAREKGAQVDVRTRCVAAYREGDIWQVTVEDVDSGAGRTIQAKALVNAAGPWVSEVLHQRVRQNAGDKIRMVRGSHIVVKKLYDHDRSYIFQNADGRIMFTIPYEQDFTLLGTTDQDHKGDPGNVVITDEETVYLCHAASEYFQKPITTEDVVWAYSGVRPLYDDGAKEAKAATRDYVLTVQDQGGTAPILNVFGGKITTFRRLAESALEKLAPYFPDMKPIWTAKASLPGGDFAVDAVDRRLAELQTAYPFLTPAWARRLLRAYGTRVGEILGDATSAEDLGVAFGATLTEAEVRYLLEKEWARTADDVIWRRSKLGLRLTVSEIAALDDWMVHNRPRIAVSAAE